MQGTISIFFSEGTWHAWALALESLQISLTARKYCHRFFIQKRINRWYRRKIAGALFLDGGFPRGLKVRGSVWKAAHIGKRAWNPLNKQTHGSWFLINYKSALRSAPSALNPRFPLGKLSRGVGGLFCHSGRLTMYVCVLFLGFFGQSMRGLDYREFEKAEMPENASMCMKMLPKYVEATLLS